MTGRLIQIIDSDQDLLHDLEEQLCRYGYEVALFEEPAAAQRTQMIRPAVSVMNVKFFTQDSSPQDKTGSRAGGENLNSDEEEKGKSALICLSDEDNMQSRLEAVRHGAVAFLTKPINMDALVGRLDELTRASGKQPGRVLIVEPDAEFALHLTWILGEAGMAASMAVNPRSIMESLVEYNSEIILMNLYFPDMLGMELASILRQQQAFQSIPIVFYSRDTSRDRKLAALRKGGDGFLTLPIESDHLIAEVETRLTRYRIMRSLIVQDRLTGLLNHTRLRELLNRELIRATRRQTEIHLAMIDIDQFKEVNDTYGHQMGDRVIKSLARLLKQRIWDEDILGRYGGEEFAVIFRTFDAHTAARILNEIRIDFSQLRQGTEGNSFFSTFSAGIASFPRYRAARPLVDAVFQAVRRVKNRGGNRVALMGHSRDS